MNLCFLSSLEEGSFFVFLQVNSLFLHDIGDAFNQVIVLGDNGGPDERCHVFFDVVCFVSFVAQGVSSLAGERAGAVSLPSYIGGNTFDGAQGLKTQQNFLDIVVKLLY